MNPQLTLERAKALGASLTMAQSASLVLAFAAVVALVSGSAYMMNRQGYVLLFSDLDAESASDVVGRLKSSKVPYQLAEGGRSVRVPESRLDELRLEFASQGLPASGRIGFEIFDKVSFGATEFLEQVNFRRALEGEIARTIATLSEVASARVHVATAKSSLFESREQPAKASVVLKLRGNRPLAAATARGICALVAASVEGLRPESVVILDSYGRPLSRPGEEADSGPLGGPTMERQLAVEHDLTTKLVNLIEPVVGAGRVRVNVAARLNAQTEEQTEQRWDPSTAVVRSRQTTSDSTPLAAAAGGVAGSRSNLPDAPAKPPAPDVPAVVPPDARMAGRSADTTNYEISYTTRHTVRPFGEIARLSVAVIVDDQVVAKAGSDGTVARTFKRREREELQKLQALASAAVGLDPARGDQLTVENMAFEDRAFLDEGPPPSFWQQNAPRLTELGRIAGIFVLGLLAFLLVVRPVVKHALALPVGGSVAAPAAGAALAGPRGTTPGLPRTIQDLEGAIEAELQAAEMAQAGERQRVPVLAKRLGTMTLQEPEHAARLVRAWLQEDRSGR